ncbi:hypothetical protein F4803DRAFT_546793 [Xylaria telfairii]|nr:hypothetical protein F4803DRAFT_546793 [Xylaria telfairii]
MAATRDAFRDTILDADDEAWLLSRGLVVITNNKIYLAPQITFIKCPVNILPPDGAGTSTSDAEKDELPRFFSRGAEILVYLGFLESRAEEVVGHAACVLREHPQMADPWLKIAICSAVPDSVADIGPETENWWPLFQQQGLSEQLYSAIMHPEFIQIRKTRTAKFWIRDMMEIRYGLLLMIHECSRERGAQLRKPRENGLSQTSNAHNYRSRTGRTSTGGPPADEA